METSEKYRPIQNYFNGEGKIVIWPSKRNHLPRQILILEFLAEKFEPNRHYTEKEVNEILNQYHTFGDPALLRRELFGRKLLNRTIDGRAYWLVSATQNAE
ncbi:DUF2087 domain-containing protein [Sphingobacteriales bacterium UPWRP_1]|nr:hypothetical protein BVG80_11125 [Sphingobacteriales bacterium TSM_CSM]PSJ74260.1 DUF2087 domain-containing protein [Sphingobacteriales bacterium UPWRP_1]